ncbi:MAG: DUF5659 domain-containing protein [Geobacter sp.]
MPPTLTMTIRDRNLTAFLLANGFTCRHVPRDDGSAVDAEFQWSEELDQARQAYLSNRPVPVQSFIAACRHLGDQIKLFQQQKRGRL